MCCWSQKWSQRANINKYLVTKIHDVFLYILIQDNCYKYLKTLWSQADSNRLPSACDVVAKKTVNTSY